MESKSRWAWVVAALVAASCSSTQATPGTAGTDGGLEGGAIINHSGDDAGTEAGASSNDAALANAASATIGTAGGVVAVRNGSATLTVPSAALAKMTTITLLDCGPYRPG